MAGQFSPFVKGRGADIYAMMMILTVVLMILTMVLMMMMMMMTIQFQVLWE